MLKWFALSTLTSLGLLVAYLFIYLGGYKSVKIDKVLYPPLQMIYQIHTGPYYKIDSALEEIEKWAQQHQIACPQTFSEYLDDPDRVSEDRLRARVGCIVNQPVNPLPDKFSYEAIAERWVIKAEFSGAPSISPIKVYPAVKKYLDEHRVKSSLPPLHIYQLDPTGQFSTHYLFPLDLPLLNDQSKNLPNESMKSDPHGLHLKDSHLTHQEAIDRAQRVSQVSYELDFDLSQKGPSFTGISRIHFIYQRQNNEPLRVDFTNGEILSLELNGQPISPNYNGRELQVPISTMKSGDNLIKINFKGLYSKDGRGLVRFEDPVDHRVYTYTQLEPFDANRVFPCFDQPDLKATYKIKVKAPKDWVVISSVRESKIDKTSLSTQTWSFPQSARFSTYVWSLHSGPYKEWISQAGNIPLRLFVRQSLAKYVTPDEWFQTTRLGLSFYHQYFSYPYPYLKYDQIIAPEFNAGAMENVAAVTFSERYVLRGPRSNHDRLTLAETILHEMAHMWFGNLVTMKWWNDLWLNESFATYMSFIALDPIPEFHEMTWRSFFGMKAWAYWEDQLVTTHPIESTIANTQQAMASFDGITYGKGASVMKQLAYYIGADYFQRGLQNYFKKFAGLNTELPDFMHSLSQASGVNLESWQKQWLQTASLNTLTVKYQCKDSHIQQLILQQSAPQEYPYWRSHRFQIALYQQQQNQNKGMATKVSSPALQVSEVFSVQIAEGEKEMEVTEAKGKPCPILVDPNYGDYGYMKVRLDERTLVHLPRYLQYVKDPFARELFLRALWDLVRDGELELSEFATIA